MDLEFLSPLEFSESLSSLQQFQGERKGEKSTSHIRSGNWKMLFFYVHEREDLKQFDLVVRAGI